MRPSYPERQAWRDMKRRCLCPTFKQWKDYGGRGIKVCDRWLDYKNFIADMGPRPEGGTLERKDNNGHYEPGNCFWATRSQQANNRRDCRYVEIGGVVRTFHDWCIVLGLNYRSAQSRVWRGASHVEALTKPWSTRNAVV